MSVILMTTLFITASILKGEIWCWSLLGLIKGQKVKPHCLVQIQPRHKWVEIEN